MAGATSIAPTTTRPKSSDMDTSAWKRLCASRLQQGIALGAPTGIESEIARVMCERVDALERIRFVNSGTEATLQRDSLGAGLHQARQNRQV